MTLEEKVGKEYFKLVTEINPRKIINNEDIEKNEGEGNEFKKNNGMSSFFSRLWNKLFSDGSYRLEEVLERAKSIKS